MLAGKPINEPIAAQGPFVLNEKNELYKAFDDYQCGKNGFEGHPHLLGSPFLLSSEL
jgi:hypothetical protein